MPPRVCVCVWGGGGALNIVIWLRGRPQNQIDMVYNSYIFNSPFKVVIHKRLIYILRRKAWYNFVDLMAKNILNYIERIMTQCRANVYLALETYDFNRRNPLISEMEPTTVNLQIIFSLQQAYVINICS